MQITAVFQKTDRGWGRRIAENLEESSPSDWRFTLHSAPSSLPLVIDEPERFIPHDMIRSDLLLVLTETQGLAQLIPDFAEVVCAETVLAPVDGKEWFPRGLQNQIRDRLEKMGTAFRFPSPFCSLHVGNQDNQYLKKFSAEFGRPEYEILYSNDVVKDVRIKCSAPCGNSAYIARELKGVKIDEAEKKGALFHQYYPCLASVDIIHSSAYITQEAVKRSLNFCG